MRHLSAVFILLGLIVGASTAFADPIVIATRAIDSTETHPATVGSGTGRFSLYYPRGPILFEDFRISTGTVGHTFVADAGSDPDFGAFAERATNGRGNFIEWIFGPPFGAAPGGGGGEGAGSEWALFGRPDGPPDFRGFTISSLTLHVNSFSAGPASMPGFEQLAFRGTLSVLGTGVQSPAAVPEPASVTLFLSGAFGLAAAVRRRREQAL